MAVSSVSYSKTPQAKDDAYQVLTYGLTYFNVMVNDQTSSKTMYSIDNGVSATLNGGPQDLLTKDKSFSSAPSSGYELSALGARIWIKTDGTIAYDASTIPLASRPAAGNSIVDTFTYAIQMGDGTISWAKVKIVVGNHAPTVAALTASAIEDGPASSVYALKNTSDDFTANLSVVNLPAAMPAGVTYDAATKTFSLDPSVQAYQHLAAGQTTTVTVTYGVSDGIASTPDSITWTVTGVNDAASISGGNTGDVQEDGNGSAGGTLSVSDVDDGEAMFGAVAPSALHGAYGDFTFSGGEWTYTLNNDSDAVQSLGEGETRTDTLTVNSKDGTAHSTITVTITGTNDAPVVSAPVTGSATEDGPASSLDALAHASDEDASDTLSVTGLPDDLPAGVTYDAGTHTFSLDPTNDAYQHLSEGAHTTVTVSYQVTDGHVTVDQTASWDVTGVNDAASIDGEYTGNVKEDTTATAGGTVNVSDVDDGEAHFQAVPDAALHGTYGDFTFDNGAWTYTLNNDSDAVQDLGEGVTKEDTLTVTSQDGTASETITVEVVGTNDAPIVSGPVSGTATEDGDASSVDALGNATDRDTGDTLSVSDLPGSLPAGVSYDEETHTFTLDPSDNAYQHLAAGAHTTVSIDYSVSDGIASTTTSVSWDVVGVNDGATMGGTYTGTVMEDTTLVASGALTVSDVDDGENGYAAVSGSALHGTYGNFTFDGSTGAWSYTLRNSDANVQALNSGQQVSDSLTVSSIDGSASETIQITVNGLDEPVVVNLISTYQINHGINESDHQTITGFDSNDVLKMDGPISYVGFSVSDVNGDGHLDTVVKFMDNGGNAHAPFDVTLLGYTGFDASHVI
jgi:VCBS repeat-containing protein